MREMAPMASVTRSTATMSSRSAAYSASWRDSARSTSV